MKLLFKLLTITALLSSAQAARDIFVYTFSNEDKEIADLVLRTMLQKGVDEDSIKFIVKSNPCEDTYKSALLHACFYGENLSKMKIVRQNVQVLSNTYQK